MDTEYKVLMIDDDELIARSTAEYFNILGLKTAYVTSYDAAVEFLDTPMKYHCFCLTSTSVTDRALICAGRSEKAMICPFCSSVPERVMMM